MVGLGWDGIGLGTLCGAIVCAFAVLIMRNYGRLQNKNRKTWGKFPYWIQNHLFVFVNHPEVLKHVLQKWGGDI